MANPYTGLPDHHFWRRAISNVERHLFDPVVATRFTLDRRDRVATAGSCFAQHISRRLARLGFNYFVPENGQGLTESSRAGRNFGVFSARYGNIYTARQLVQLLEEAFGRRSPAENAWRRADGRYVDPLRPNIEPAGFADPGEVAASRRAHLACVRTLFEQADVFVFTLGLTEGWRSKVDGTVFPLAPGVSGGELDESIHEFVNFGVPEVEQDLAAFLDAIRLVNPAVRVLLTVSPVPLVATYEKRNVLVSTTYSKSVLRVAAETAYRKYPWVDYFPSYEIITGSFNGGLYYEEDGREVNHLGVAHAMRSFAANYLAGAVKARSDRSAPVTLDQPVQSGVICDEESIAAVTDTER